VGSALFPLFTVIFDGDAEMAWRTVCIVPALVGFVTGITVYFISDDSPKGNYSELKKNGTMPNVSAISSCGRGTTNLNTWIMFIQYACCFGVELTMYNATALYFRDEFGLNTESAGAITAIFGWMNLFARALGGWVSDRANAQYGMRGRLWAQSLLLIAEGMMVLIFVKAETLGTAILVMVIFSIFVQASEGTSFAIVPYIDPQSTGTISGIVGAGGNCGAVGFGFAFRQFSYEKAFMIMGLTILGSAILSIFIVIKGQNTMLSCIRKSSVVKNSSEISAILAQQEEERQESDI
jgi:NNP family nitrate/nitrite transporter-like MFS transporter